MPQNSARPPGSPPRVLDGKFRVLEPLRSTAETSTFLAEHVSIKRQVELRCLARDVSPTSEAAGRLVREARAMGAVSHTGVQSVVDSGLDPEGRPYVVYEAIRGGTELTAILAASPSGLSSARAGRIVLSTAEAVRALHREGVVVRGLGPENIVVLPELDGEEPVKLRGLDAVAFLAETQPRDDVPFTPWTAPETRRRGTSADVRADVFALGAMLRHLVTGQVGSTRPLPDEVRRAVERATCADPDDRFPDVDVFLQAIALLVPGQHKAFRDSIPTPVDPLAADLQWLTQRRSTRHGQRTVARGTAKVHLLPVLLAIEAIFRRLGAQGWGELAALVPGVDELLPGSGKTEQHLASGVPVELFARVLAAADGIAGIGDLALLTEIGEAVAQRGLRRLFPALPEPTDAATLVESFPYLWSRVTLQGEPQPAERDHNAARLLVRGQVEPSLELSGFVAGLLRAALRQTGVRDSEVYLTSCQALGDAHDVFGVRWS